MRRFVDLHTHSYVSDGSFSPSALIASADSIKLAAIALTDHDTTAGIAEAREAARGFPELTFIAGIELSAMWPDGVMHILGLGIDEDSSALADLSERLRASRTERNPKIVDKLRQMGIDITMDDVNETAGGDRDSRIVSRVHIAQTLVSKGVVKNTGEAFGRYIGDDSPAYVPKDTLKPAEVISAIHDAGGVAILAHPVQLNYSNSAQLLRIIRELIRAKIDGIEVYHSSHTPQQVRQYLDLAREFNLDIAGGSDFHGACKPDVGLGMPRVPLDAIAGKLRSMISA